MNYFNYQPRKSSQVQIGNTPLGGGNPLRIQSMGNTSTLDTEASAAQAERIVQAGAHYVRFTAQGVREAQNLGEIRTLLHQRGITAPLVADIHFNPKAAEAAAQVVEKVRINPGNFVDSARTFRHIDYTDEQYAQEIAALEARFKELLTLCRAHQTALRIGVNHGSLSDRIMSRYGNTPAGMVESAMEFLRVCQREAFNNVVISIKSSNTVVMVTTMRLLAHTMEQEGMHYPLHLGVTEAGEGEDGRLRSAVGIGALLSDGIGDTLRVSLSEAPEREVPVAQKLADYIAARVGHPHIAATPAPHYNYLAPEARMTHAVGNIGGKQSPVVIALGEPKELNQGATPPDYLWLQEGEEPTALRPEQAIIRPWASYQAAAGVYPQLEVSELPLLETLEAERIFLQVSYPQLTPAVIETLKHDNRVVLLLHSDHANPVGELRAALHTLMVAECTTPVVIYRHYAEAEGETLQLKAGADLGVMLLDGFANGILLANEGATPLGEVTRYAFGILQATRQRITQTEYISCPSCGRTLFDLEGAIARVKGATSHLKGLKIAVMGCIVNGPGEMADADFGYVGAARGKVSLYRGKECVTKNIPEEIAVEALIELIRESGCWVDAH